MARPAMQCEEEGDGQSKLSESNWWRPPIIWWVETMGVTGNTTFIIGLSTVSVVICDLKPW